MATTFASATQKRTLASACPALVVGAGDMALHASITASPFVVGRANEASLQLKEYLDLVQSKDKYYSFRVVMEQLAIWPFNWPSGAVQK